MIYLRVGTATAEIRNAVANYNADQQCNDPLHGVTLERILSELVAHYGWEEMAREVDIRCFTNNPSLKSSLKFLRRTPWARDKVEAFYLWHKMNVAQ